MKFFFFFLFISKIIYAHPGIGIVKDSKGDIYYTDLMQVWKISKSKKTVAVPGVHTHELYIDRDDNLYGGNEKYDGTSKFFHYLWRLHPDGTLDTIITTREAYVDIDFSLARDWEGNEYYTRQFTRDSNTQNIYKRTPGGVETIFARGDFFGVKWLHPQRDGSILYTQKNRIFRVLPSGEIKVVIDDIRKDKKGNLSPTVWGLWQDDSGDVYVAVLSEGVVKKILPNGSLQEFYSSEKKWSPAHGVFDEKGKLWLMEISDNNEIRVIEVTGKNLASKLMRLSTFHYVFAIAIFLLFVFLIWKRLKFKKI